jgi:hypothetical protein
MATADDIPTDLALEIGADLDPKRFVAAAREFFAYVESAAALPGASTRLDWRVKVREGSSILALAPAPSVLQAEALAAYARVEAATKALVSGDFSAATLDDATLEHARKLSDLAVAKDGTVPMQVWVCRRPILFGPDVGNFIREETKPAYHDFGSIEGTLNAIQDAAGGLELRVRDLLWPRPVRCSVPEDMLGDAINHFRKRVELFGEIHYRKDNTPESIRVERLDPLPSDDDLPSIDDVRGLLNVRAA